MESVQEYFEAIWPIVTIVAIAAALAWLASRVARRGQDDTSMLLYQLFNWANVSVAIIAIIVVLPLTEKTQGQVLSLLGLVLTAVIALASTSFVSNAMAGIMLQSTQPFRPGDYIKVNDQFGRVTRRSLVHTQIQTEWRDLTTLPNLLLINNPVTVLHREGTIIFAEVSLGYDLPYTQVEELMLIAGADAGLDEPFVLLHELLDHAVVYRICGFLTSMNNLLGARSNLRKTILEQMHANGIEIVSPNFMNQRVLDPGKKIIPPVPVVPNRDRAEAASQPPEDKIFDMALAAAGVEELKQKLEETREAIKNQRALLKAASEETREDVKQRLTHLEQQELWCARKLEQRAASE